MRHKVFAFLMVVASSAAHVFHVFWVSSINNMGAQSSRQEGVLRIIQRELFLFLNENIYCDPSLEPSQRDGSDEVSQHMF